MTRSSAPRTVQRWLESHNYLGLNKMTRKELRVHTHPRTHPPNYPTMSNQVLSARATGTRNENSLRGWRTNVWMPYELKAKNKIGLWQRFQVPLKRKSSDKDVCSTIKRAEEEDASLQEQQRERDWSHKLLESTPIVNEQPWLNREQPTH